MRTATSTTERILVAMSGGVDSSVCASLLLREGLDVRGTVLDLSDRHTDSVELAKRACEELSIPLSVVDMRREFERLVIEPFCETYASGATPNPCVMCNPTVKFTAIVKEAERQGIDRIATGHYARVERSEKGFLLKTARCLPRDQSYMLYRLTQKQLSMLTLPLGELTKQEVREYAERMGLSSSGAPDSQEICFLKEGESYIDFLNARGVIPKKGNIISPEGVIVAAHSGVAAFTIGQRKGLGVSLGRPAFVKAINPCGDVLLGYAGDEYESGARLHEIVLNPEYEGLSAGSFSVKIRSAAKPQGASVEFFGDCAELVFDAPARAVAKGQSAVLYDGDTMVGGGVII